MRLSAWDVIWPYDPQARPPKPKLWVCVEPDCLWFLRINSREHPGSVLLDKKEHPFLDRDSWLHCWGELIETDDYELAELLNRQGDPRRRGVIGQIAPRVREEVRRAIGGSPLLSPDKIRRISAALQAA